MVFALKMGGRGERPMAQRMNLCCIHKKSNQIKKQPLSGSPLNRNKTVSYSLLFSTVFICCLVEVVVTENCGMGDRRTAREKEKKGKE